MLAMLLKVFPLLLGTLVAQSAGIEVFYNLTAGNPGLLTPCTVHNLKGTFVEEVASLFDPATDGLVMVSYATDDLGCLQTPEFLEVHLNYTFRVRAFLPKPREIAYPVPIFYAYLWSEQNELIPLAYHMGPKEDGWVEWEEMVPSYIEYPQKFKIEIRSDLFTAKYVAIRWFGLSD